MKMAGCTTKKLICVSLTLLLTIAVLTTGENVPKDQIKVSEFDVMPGGQVHEHEDTWNGVTCKLTYACQGGTKEKWSLQISASPGNKEFSCSVERPGKTSYLYFLNFNLEVPGAAVLTGQAFGNNDKALGPDEYTVDSASGLLSSEDSGFKNELSKIYIYGTTRHGEL